MQTVNYPAKMSLSFGIFVALVMMLALSGRSTVHAQGSPQRTKQFKEGEERDEKQKR